MLSYQHIYHAGNMADVQKHLWLLTVLEYLTRKDKPFFWADTHSGRGLYDLNAPEAQKIAEYKSGIARIKHKLAETNEPILKLYHEKIDGLNNGEEIMTYPGSAYLAASMLRADDKFCGYELHPKEFEHLKRNLGRMKNVTLRHQDGYAGLKAICPPPIKRGGVLIDPSYEVKEEYVTAAKCAKETLRRWPLAIIMVWYPILAANRHDMMCEDLESIAQSFDCQYIRDEWHFEGVEKGMTGTGMFIINPPYSCADTMRKVKSDLSL